MTENINREAITKSEATSLARKGEDAYEVRKGLRVFGFYDNIETAEAMAEFYDADVFDWATGEYA